MTPPIPHLVGMVHLEPLPGAPHYSGSMGKLTERALGEASALASAGFPALLVENFGDVPFYAETVPPETIAAMTLIAGKVKEETGLPLGINVLRNDIMAALGIATATGAEFVRVNVLVGTMYTDQGPISGRAAEALRKRSALGADIEIWADVMVKHAAPPQGVRPEQAAADTVERGLADAVIVSGPGTGAEPDLDEARRIRDAVPTRTRIVVGSGATTDNLMRLVEVADTVIVGSSIKVSGDARNDVDPLRAQAFVETARDLGLR